MHDDGLTLSATCTIAALDRLELPTDWTAAPLVGQCCRALLGSFKIWNRATVGGLPQTVPPMQGAFLDAQGFQCGFWVVGQFEFIGLHIAHFAERTLVAFVAFSYRLIFVDVARRIRTPLAWFALIPLRRLYENVERYLPSLGRDLEWPRWNGSIVHRHWPPTSISALKIETGCATGAMV